MSHCHYRDVNLYFLLDAKGSCLREQKQRVYSAVLAVIASNSAAKSLSYTKLFLHSQPIAIRSSNLLGNFAYTACFSMPIHQAKEQSIFAMVCCYLNESLTDVHCCHFEYQQTPPQISLICSVLQRIYLPV